MADSSDASVELHLDPITTGVRAARAFVRAQLHDWGRDDIAETAALVVSELVTNAVLHARSPVEVRLVRSGDAVQVRVSDASPTLPRPRPAEEPAITGRGLRLVEAVAAEWGVEPAAPGKVVWATVRS